MLQISLSIKEAMDVLENCIVSSGASCECVGNYFNESNDGKQVGVLIFEKYFMRNDSRAGLTVVLNNLSGRTTVYYKGSGGGTGAFFKFDWGISEDLESLVEKSLDNYIV